MTIMEREGQASALLIIGAVILITITFVYVIRSPERTPLQAQNAQPEDNLQDQTRQFVTACLSSTLEDGVRFVANRGGYYRIPPDMESYEGIVPYYKTQTNTRIPSDDDVEKGIGRYVQEAIWVCLQGFEPLQGKGAEINAVEASIAITVTDNQVDASAKIPITIKSQTKQTSLSDFSATAPARLPAMKRIAEAITKADEATPIERFEGLLRQDAFQGNIIFDNMTKVYTIKDIGRKITWGFAVNGGAEGQ